MVRLFSVSLLVIFLVIAIVTAAWLYNQQKKLSLEYTIATQKWAELRLALETKLHQAKEEITNLNKKIQQLNIKIDNFEIETKNLKNKVSFFEKERENLSKKLKIAIQSKEKLQKKITQFSIESQRETPSDEYIAKLIRDKATLQVMVEGLEDKLEQRERQLDSILKEKKDIEDKLNNIDYYQDELESKLDNAEKIQDKLTQELIDQRKINLMTSKELETVRKEKLALEEKLLNLTKEKQGFKNAVKEMENKLNRLILERNSLLRQVSDLNKLLEDKIVQVGKVKSGLEDAIKETKQIALSKALDTISSVELPPIIVKSQGDINSSNESSAPVVTSGDIKNQNGLSLSPNQEEKSISFYNLSTQDLKGKILLVNRQQQFVVINLGKNDGVKFGMIFDVYRNEQKIGSLRVVEVRDNLSAADIIKSSNNIIQKNDIVKLR